ncbi:MAG: hypothetical protein RL512_212, partial [Bacteroidota bacterium]
AVRFVDAKTIPFDNYNSFNIRGVVPDFESIHFSVNGFPAIDNDGVFLRYSSQGKQHRNY